MNSATRKRHRHHDNGFVTPTAEILAAPVIAATPVRLDLGCGSKPREGYVGVDRLPFDGKVQHVLDLGRERWPWADSSVDEIWSSHFLEHLTAGERCHAMNETWRVLKPGRWGQGKPEGGFAIYVVPHWASCRAYGDPTHQWPPIGEFFIYYLLREWRMQNAPHTDASINPEMYSCDLEAVVGNSWNQSLQVRNEEYRAFAMANYKEAIADLHLHLMPRK